MSKRLKRNILFGLAIAAIALLAVLELFNKRIFASLENGESLYTISTRFVGGFACVLFLCLGSSRRMLSPKLGSRALLIFLPCMLIAINNFPFVTYFGG